MAKEGLRLEEEKVPRFGGKRPGSPFPPLKQEQEQVAFAGFKGRVLPCRRLSRPTEDFAGPMWVFKSHVF